MISETPGTSTNSLASRSNRNRASRRPRFGTGIFLILLGLVLALNQWDRLPVHDLSRHWPLILIALGLGRMVDRGFFATGPHVAILVGLFFELEAFGQHDWIHQAWPLGVVWIGLIITLRALRPRSSSACEWSHE